MTFLTIRDFTPYDEDGQSLGYRDGSDPSTIWIHFHWTDKRNELTMEPDVRMKRWPGGARDYAVELVGANSQPKTVSSVGIHLDVKL